ncbi:MAG TPA: hypothetical protein VG347_03235 [Verrucomicrobiae bacterium]|nr:hypothetical protein [Verrucomicrobiae bacterium]
MKLLRVEGDEFEFEFFPVEKGLLFHLLGLYPAVPVSYHKLTKGSHIPHEAENQELLNDAIKAQREANQQEIIALVKDAGRFTDGKDFTRAVFQRGELEWLLQVLNDVRVGNWLAAGSPDPQQKRKMRRDAKSAQHVMLMELTGGFEMLFLGSLNGTLEAGAEEL